MNKEQLTTAQKLLKTALFLGVSAALGYGIGFTTDNPLAFGSLATPIVNLVLVTVKNLIDPNVKNV